MFILLWTFVLFVYSAKGEMPYCHNSSSPLFQSNHALCNMTRAFTLPASGPHELFEGPDVSAILQLLPTFAPTSSLSPQCRAHSETFQTDLKELKLWALQMYDSTAKASSGLLNGNTVLLGDYDQCMGVDNTQGITGKYCITTIYIEPVIRARGGAKRRMVHKVLDMMQSHNAMKTSYHDDMQFLPTFSPVTWAACVPASCDERDVEVALQDVLRPVNGTSGLEFKILVQPGNCVTKDNNPIEISAIATVGLFLMIFLLAVWGTMHEKTYTQENGDLAPEATKGTFRRVLLAFSMRRNTRTLLDTSGPEDELSCVHGLRAAASIFIYLIHRSVFAMFYPFTNRTSVAEFLEGDWTMLFRAFWNWVDSFVVLSGLLTSFYAFKKLQDGRKLNIPRMYLQRYIKFTPMLFMMALALQNLMQYQISTPQRIRIVDHYIQNCKRGLLPVITYTNTMEGFDKMCYPPSHQLATDMHMYLTAPFFVLALWKWPRAGPLSLLVLLTALSVLKYYVVLTKHLGSFLYYGISVKEMIVSANYIYINAIHRLTPYLCGVGLGYLLRVWAGKCTLSRVQMAAGTAIAFAGAFYSFYGVSHSARRDYIFDVQEAAIFAVFQPLLWSFALCWLIFCCATGQAPEWLRRGLSWKGFVIFSRLSYAVYVVQIYVIAVNVGNSMNAEYFRITKLIDLNEITAVAVISLLCTLLFLLPLQDLWNIAAGTYESPVKKENKTQQISDQSATGIARVAKLCQD